MPLPPFGGDRGLHARVLEDGLGVKHGEEASRHHVVDAPVVVAHFLERVFGARRDDGVVVAHLLVIDDTPERKHVEPDDVFGGLAVLAMRAHELRDRLDLLDHVARQIARVGARIGQRLVLLVQALRRCQRPLG